jgi:hypothetical protein
MEEQKRQTTDDKSKDLPINPGRSPFSKPDNQRRNLHSPDSGREEIADDDLSLSAEDLEKLERGES